MYCSNCGKKVDHSDDLFCSECGSRLLHWSDSEASSADASAEDPIDYSELSPESIVSDIRSVNKKRLLLVFGIIIIGLLAIYQIVLLASDTKLGFAKEQIDEIASYYQQMWNRSEEIELQEALSGAVAAGEGDEILKYWQDKVDLAETELLEMRGDLTAAEQEKLDAYYIEKIGQDCPYK